MGSVGVIGCAFALTACGVEATADDPGAAEPAYGDITALFDRAIAPTCSLNNGVCHNSNNYPDLHTIEKLVDTIDQPCNVEVTEPLQIHDACEPPGDHLVAGTIDVRIVQATVTATQVVLVVDPAPSSLAVGTANVEIHRDAIVFALGDFDTSVAAVSGTRVTLELGTAPAREFFDVTVFPPGPLRVHVGDPNGNGVEGARVMPMPLVAPGDPERSYLMRRLIDPAFGELMPRQCRTWSDAANRALACWIAGLGQRGAYDPIDYASCRMDVAGLGKCVD